MKKKTLILGIKIFAIVLWIIALFVPNIYEEFENVEVVDYYQTNLEETTKTTMYFDVEFSKDVYKGHIALGFSETEDGEYDLEIAVPFTNHEGNIVRIEISSEEFEEFDEIYYTYVGSIITTTTVNMLNKIMYPVAIALAVLLIFILRIQYKEYVVEGKTVQIYAGIANHMVYVDNIQAYSEKYLFTNKKRMLTIPLSDKVEMDITFRANNKIETVSRNRPVIENGNIVEPVVSEEVSVGSLEAAEERIETATEYEKIENKDANENEGSGDLIQTEKTENFEKQEEPKKEATEETNQ